MTASEVTSVAHVLWSAEVGGIERFVCDLVPAQRRLGLRVGVALARAEGPFAARIAAAGAEILPLGLASGYDLHPRRIARGARLLRGSAVVHLHGFNVPFAAMALATRRPLVHTEHGTFGLGRELRGPERLKRRLLGSFLHRATVAANSTHTARQLARVHGLDADAIAVVPNGTALPDRVGEGSPDGTLRVLSVGRLVAFKRVDRAIAAVARARRSPVSLDVVGDGPLRGELEALAASLGVGDRVRFLGFRDDVHALLAEADVLVQASEGEPFGLAIIEAAASGALPVVFADGGGALEALPPDGIVVRDVDELAGTLEALVGSPALAPDARRQRAGWVRERFSIDAAARAYRTLYERAAERASGVRRRTVT